MVNIWLKLFSTLYEQLIIGYRPMNNLQVILKHLFSLGYYFL